jgi:hypothetical protein
MYYKFNNVSSTTNPDTLAIASVTGSDPSGWSVSSIWNNGTREPFVFVHVTGYVQDGAKAYTVDLTDDISTLEDRANSPTYIGNRNTMWYAAHHKMKAEGYSHGMDVCAASVDEEELGVLKITWTIGSPKIAVGSRNAIQVAPNPFNPSTTLSFTLGRPDHAKLDVYSITGQKVATLVDSHLSAGMHQYTFDGSRLSSSVYFYRLKTSQGVEHGKCMLIK